MTVVADSLPAAGTPGKERMEAPEDVAVMLPDDVEQDPDVVEPTYILFEAYGGRIRLRLRHRRDLTGQIFGGGDTDGIEFSWNGDDEMDQTQGDGWAELQPDGSLQSAICFHGGDEANFIARPWTSSTTC